MKLIICFIVFTAVPYGLGADTYWAIMRSDQNYWRMDYPRLVSRTGVQFKRFTTGGLRTLQDLLNDQVFRSRTYDKDSAVLKALDNAINNTDEEIAWYGDDERAGIQMLIVFIDQVTYFVMYGGIPPW